MLKSGKMGISIQNPKIIACSIVGVMFAVVPIVEYRQRDTGIADQGSRNVGLYMRKDPVGKLGDGRQVLFGRMAINADGDVRVKHAMPEPATVYEEIILDVRHFRMPAYRLMAMRVCLYTALDAARAMDTLDAEILDHTETPTHSSYVYYDVPVSKEHRLYPDAICRHLWRRCELRCQASPSKA